MKIAITSTIHLLTYTNYGSILQACALQKTLREMGHQPFMVQLRRKPRLERRLGGILPLSWVTAFFNAVYFVRLCRFGVRRTWGFFSLAHRYLSFSPLVYELEDAEMPEADAYLCGSDQVWGDHPESGAFPACKFFADKPGPQCFSYAASANWDALSEHWRQLAGRFLPQFRAVSVREDRGVEICRELGVQDCSLVCDPVFLVKPEEWRRLIPSRPLIAEPYVLFYVLNTADLTQTPHAAVQRYCREKGYRFINLAAQGAESTDTAKLSRRIGPLDFLNLICHAQAIVTNSFHGSMFSALFDRPFLTCLQFGATAAENSRFTSSLRLLGQEVRLCRGNEANLTLLELPPHVAEKRIPEWRREGLIFLQQTLDCIAKDTKDSALIDTI